MVSTLKKATVINDYVGIAISKHTNNTVLGFVVWSDELSYQWLTNIVT